MTEKDKTLWSRTRKILIKSHQLVFPCEIIITPWGVPVYSAAMAGFCQQSERQLRSGSDSPPSSPACLSRLATEHTVFPPKTITNSWSPSGCCGQRSWRTLMEERRDFSLKMERTRGKTSAARRFSRGRRALCDPWRTHPHSLRVWVAYSMGNAAGSVSLWCCLAVSEQDWQESVTSFWRACKRGRSYSGTLGWSGPCRRAGSFWSLRRSEGGPQASSRDRCLPGHPSCVHWRCPAGPAAGSPGGAFARSRCCLPGSRNLCRKTSGGHAPPLETFLHISGKPLWSALSGCCPRSVGGWLRSVLCTASLQPATACFRQIQPFLGY